MDIQYTGEHLLPGQIGKISVLIAFVFALTSFIAYFAAAQKKDPLQNISWIRFARWMFLVHLIGIVGIVAALYYIIHNHLFEYHYAWQHSSRSLPTRYLFSCFWEGQEGSFLLWMFWHAVLGLVLIKTSRVWESLVMSIVALTQVFLGSMLLGFSVGSIKIGSNPFNLLREVVEAPIFSRADYLTFITDGNGLNPLLQNYWMVIHPPTLFLGFAATLIPFAYSLASLWKGDWKGWLKPVLPWTLFAGLSLGAGILMGGAWAYEALSFGGFWAWDPVENASLVPWLTLIAGLHTLIIYKSTGQALRATYLFFIATFILVLYSTFLTRSGILGDTSVHSFTDLGMSGQLVFFLAFFMFMSFTLLAMRWQNIPHPTTEETFSSREFWMFIGALVLTISAIQITFTTSIPVWNTFFPLLNKLPFIGHLFSKKLAPPVDAVQHYNSVQVWIAIMTGIGSGFVQFLHYRHTQPKAFFIRILPAALTSLLLSVPASLLMGIRSFHYVLMFVACMFTIISNVQYMITSLRGRLRFSGASITHAGFGLLLLGALISQHNQQVISLNTSGIDFGDSFDSQSKMENILLRRYEPVRMADYEVTYLGDSLASPNHYYKVQYKRFDQRGNIIEQFILRPNAQINKNMGLVSSPDTRHYLTKDIYTHVTSVPNKEATSQAITSKFDTVAVGDTFYTARAFVVAEKLIPHLMPPEIKKNEEDISVGLRLNAYTLDGKSYTATPIYIIRKNLPIMWQDTIPELDVVFWIERILPDKGLVVVGKKEKDHESDFIIMKAIIFPYINLLWTGCLVMLVGFLISIARRSREYKSPISAH